MQIYSLYKLAADNSGIEGFEEVQAPDDATAISLVAGLPRSNAVELWQGKRKVHRFKRPDGPELIAGLRVPIRRLL